MTSGEALAVLDRFDPGNDGLASKSLELIRGLLHHSEAPFSRDQFTPGHITCTALVLHPANQKVLFMHHHRLERWLLPGGHVELPDSSLAAAAGREAVEETCVQLDTVHRPFLAGLDVHGIPPKRGEPFHLHHDLIWCLRAASDQVAITDEAPAVRWVLPDEWDSLSVAESIRNSIRRAALSV